MSETTTEELFTLPDISERLEQRGKFNERRLLELTKIALQDVDLQFDDLAV